MITLFSKINPGVIWLLIAIATDVLSTFYSAKANGLVNKLDQAIALVLYLISFTCAAIALKYMQAGILYVLWSGIGVIATAALAKVFLGQNIDLAGWIGIGFITIGLMIIAQYSNIDV
ncbi:DMT family transporter [Acinetobacter junii]|jgi:multidrug transporter EmrE-like cation transporter|uniref:Multidrug resistance protein, SMR family n=1 Tax=Acinetobacter junii SH205 TaxID=575587 RepID=D0SLE9_ACIJU|nr:SMR family transporter [Acinetobacter junii]APU49596.1 quaternary ammonium transporter [Acinetobacter junii]EEY92856.1 multidrug resistance protein, SMR family [Acinetobacter junii SH205]MDU2408727.1 SMR family transporter [Acinetobacter junii]MEB8382104.1 SMR family transporter [Acinetobacter junii]TID66543.1 quaternary ammonium transporter [Acinetobacter junii]